MIETMVIEETMSRLLSLDRVHGPILTACARACACLLPLSICPQTELKQNWRYYTLMRGVFWGRVLTLLWLSTCECIWAHTTFKRYMVEKKFRITIFFTLVCSDMSAHRLSAGTYADTLCLLGCPETHPMSLSLSLSNTDVFNLTTTHVSWES